MIIKAKEGTAEHTLGEIPVRRLLTMMNANRAYDYATGRLLNEEETIDDRMTITLGYDKFEYVGKAAKTARAIGCGFITWLILTGIVYLIGYMITGRL